VIRATYADLKAQLARIAGVSGMPQNDARVMDYTNRATQELMDERDWPSLIAWMKFKVTNRRVNVPSEFDRILQMKVNGVPMPMQSPWFEFVAGFAPWFLNPGGPEVNPQNWEDNPHNFMCQGVLDKEQVATFEEIPKDGNVYFPTIYCTANEQVSGVDQYITLQGYDNNGQWVRTNDPTNGWQDGVTLLLNGNTPPYATYCPVPFSVVTAVQKPATNGYVSLYADAAGAATPKNVFLCSYAPYDTRPYYRRYEIPNLSCNQTYCVDARLRRRFAPIVSADDWLLIPNLPALSKMVQAIYYSDSENPQQYAAYKALAVEILEKEMTSYIGKQRQKPLITVNEGFGVRRDGNYIL
jgi:hypothetical protein